MPTSWNTTARGGRYLWDLGPLEIPITAGARLRPLDEADAEELHALIEANRGLLSRWLPWAAGQTFEDTVEFLRRTRAQLARNDGVQAAIVLGEGSIAGVIGHHAVNWPHRSTSLGYWLGERYQGKGTMTAAAQALVDHAIDVWDLNRVEIRAAVDNAPSRAIPERLGFFEEGTLRQAEFVDGRHHDTVVYSTLAGEWRAGA
jgi:ribosomal-protein-serine acetyltransferase